MALPATKLREQNTDPDIVCAIYARVSTPKQARQDNIRKQLTDLPRFAKREGWEIFHTYVDDGVSGKFVKDRPEFNRLLEDAERGKFNVVLCRDIDRLGRWESDLEWAMTTDTFRQNGIRIATDKGRIWDLEDEADDLMTKLSAHFAKMERRKIFERMSGGRKDKILEGRFMGGLLPVGYTWDVRTKDFLIDEEAAELVRYIFNLSLEGKGCMTISDRLNAEGVPTLSQRNRALVEKRERDGTRSHSVKGSGVTPAEKWSPNAINKLLRNETYIGIRRITLDGEEIIQDVPPIIDGRVFKAVQRGLKERRRWTHGDPQHFYLLSGVLFCPLCGKGLRSSSAKTRKAGVKYYFYSCKGRTNKHLKDGEEKCTLPYFHVADVDRAVWIKLKDALMDPETIKAALDAEREGKKKLPKLKREIARIEELLIASSEERKAVIRLCRQGAISEADLKDQIAEIEGQESVLSGQKEALLEEVGTLEMSEDEWERFAEDLKLFRDLLDDETDAEVRQKVVRTLIGVDGQVLIYPDKRITIRGSFVGDETVVLSTPS